MARITSEEQLRELYKAPSGRAVAKEQHSLDKHARGFIALSPFLLIGTGDGASADVSPRGDAPGFAGIDGDDQVLIPDRPGNNRLDTMLNILRNPAVGLLFLVPGFREILRINGRAELRDDDALCRRFAAQGKPARSVIKVKVDAVYFHCAKAVIRSSLWDPAAQIERGKFASLGEIFEDQTGIDMSAEEIDRDLEDIYQRTLY